MRKPAIIFDLFGVVFSRGLESSIEDLKDVFNKPEYRISNAYRQNEKDFDLGKINSQEFWRRVNCKLNTNHNPNHLNQVVIGAYEEKKHTLDLVRKLKSEGYAVYLLSNYRREWFDELDKIHDFSKEFDRCFVSSDIGLIKPGHEIFDYIASEISESSQNMIFIDDQSDNVEGFKEWGGNAIQFDNIYQVEFELRNFLGLSEDTYDAHYSGIFLQTSGGAFILQRRTKDKNVENPGMISVFGGRSVNNETGVETARRELKEELGLECELNDLVHIATYSYPLNNRKWMLCKYYFLNKSVTTDDVYPLEGGGIIYKTVDAALKLRDRDLTSVPRLVFEQIADGRIEL